MTVARDSNLRDFHDYSIMANRDMKLIPVSITFSDSYLAGGEAFSLGGVNTILALLVEGSGIYQFNYVASTGKVIAYIMSTGLEPADTTDLEALGAIKALLLGY